MQNKKIWDPFVRLFHWSVVVAFTANALLLDADTDLHQWIGYAVIGLIVARIMWGFIGTTYARFSSFPPSIGQSIGQFTDMATHKVTIHPGHTPLGALMIYNLLLSLLILGGSGLLMTTDAYWGVEWPGLLHEYSVTWVEISVVAHIAAVLFESYRTKVNLPKSMVTGYKRLPVE